MNNYNKDFQDLSDNELSAEITKLAKNYQASEFPNPERKDCLSDERLRAIAKSEDLPDVEIRRHLLNCSPCFNIFQEVKNGVKSAAVSSADGLSEKGAKKFPPFSFFLKPIPALILLFLVIGVVMAVFYSSRNTTEKYIADNNKYILDDEQNRRTNSLQNVDENVGEVKEVANVKTKNSNSIFSKDKSNSFNNKKEENESAKRNNDELKLLAKNVVNLDLSKAAVFRNGESQIKTYRLPPAQTQIKVKLPENYPTGKYTISLLDEFGKSLITDQTISSNGKNVIFNLNLKNKTGSARLCVTPKGETPDCFAVKISNSP